MSYDNPLQNEHEGSHHAETITDPLTAAAEAAWLEYARGTWSETDKRIFIEGFRRGVNWQRRRIKAQERYEENHERQFGSPRDCY